MEDEQRARRTQARDGGVGDLRCFSWPGALLCSLVVISVFALPCHRKRLDRKRHHKDIEEVSTAADGRRKHLRQHLVDDGDDLRYCNLHLVGQFISCAYYDGSLFCTVVVYASRNCLSRKRVHHEAFVSKGTVAVMIAAAAAAAAATAAAKATTLPLSKLSGSTTKKSPGTLYSDNVVEEDTQTSSSSANKERDLRQQLLSKQKQRIMKARLGWQHQT